MQIDTVNKNDGDGCNILISAGADVSLKYVPTTKTRTPLEDVYDEFGFLLEKEKLIQDKNSEKSYRLYRDHFDALHQRDLYRIEKFVKMCSTSKFGALHKKFHNRVRKGIPNGIRYQVWQCLMPINDLKKKNKDVYKNLYESQGVGKVLQQIDKDINRCCRDHYLFQDRYSPHQVKLFHLLKAYSIYNKDVEYTQGMSTIAAILLMYLEEEDAFWAFCHLMSHPSFMFANLFLPGFPKLMETYYILDVLMKKHVPKVQHVISKSLDGMAYDQYLDLFFRKWILLIMNGSLPFEVSIHILDMIISEGFDALFIVLIGIMKMLQTEFVNKKSMEDLKFYIQEFDNKVIDFHLFLKTVQSSKVTRKQILTIRSTYTRKILKK